MSSPKAINGARGVAYFISMGIVGLFGGGSGTYVYLTKLTPGQLESAARPDKVTGSEVDAIRDQLLAEIQAVRAIAEANATTLTSHQENHPDQVNLFERRISTMEPQIPELRQRIQSLEDRN